MLKVERISGRDKLKLKVYSIFDSWPILITFILFLVLLYNLYKFQANISNYFFIFPLAIFFIFIYIVTNFILSKNIIIDRKAKTIKIRFWTIKFSDIKNIHLGEIHTGNIFSFENIGFELKNKIITYPGRFSPSIKGESKEIISILKKEIKLRK